MAFHLPTRTRWGLIVRPPASSDIPALIQCLRRNRAAALMNKLLSGDRMVGDGWFGVRATHGGRRGRKPVDEAGRRPAAFAVRHHPARYMLYVVPVKAAEQSHLPAIRHPVALNTSFNLKGEPIVTTPTNAFSTFSKSEMDCLVLENFLIQKASL